MNGVPHYIWKYEAQPGPLGSVGYTPEVGVTPMSILPPRRVAPTFMAAPECRGTQDLLFIVIASEILCGFRV